MKLRNFTLIITTALGMGPVFAEESKSPWHSFAGFQCGLYDTSDASLAMIEGGIGYEAGPLIHYLFIGAGQVPRDGERTGSSGGLGGMPIENTEPDLQEFEFGYRVAYRLNGKMRVFAELGAESLSGDSAATDALGNSVSLSFDSNHYFLGAGFQREVWKGINLDFSCRYLPTIEDAAFSHAGTDLLGNVNQIASDTPSFLVKLGVSYGF
jgi:hypothetical protein